MNFFLDVMLEMLECHAMFVLSATAQIERIKHDRTTSTDRLDLPEAVGPKPC